MAAGVLVAYAGVGAAYRMPRRRTGRGVWRGINRMLAAGHQTHSRCQILCRAISSIHHFQLEIISKTLKSSALFSILTVSSYNFFSLSTQKKHTAIFTGKQPDIGSSRVIRGYDIAILIIFLSCNFQKICGGNPSL